MYLVFNHAHSLTLLLPPPPLPLNIFHSLSHFLAPPSLAHHPPTPTNRHDKFSSLQVKEKTDRKRILHLLQELVTTDGQSNGAAAFSAHAVSTCLSCSQTVLNPEARQVIEGTASTLEEKNRTTLHRIRGTPSPTRTSAASSSSGRAFVPVNAAINASPGGGAAAAAATNASWSPAVCEGGWRGGGESSTVTSTTAEARGRETGSQGNHSSTGSTGSSRMDEVRPRPKSAVLNRRSSGRGGGGPSNTPSRW